MGDENEFMMMSDDGPMFALPASELKEAYEQTKPEADAVSDDELYERVTIDIPGAIIVATAMWPRIEAMIPSIEKALGSAADIERIRRLPRYTAALAQAQRLFKVTFEPVAPIKEWADELAGLHDLYFTHAEALVKSGLMDPEVLPSVRSHVSYKALAFNIGDLIQAFRSNAKRIAGRTPITEASLADTDAKSQRLVRAIAAQEYRTSQQSAVRASRRRFFSLFARAYDEARRAEGFMRWFENEPEMVIVSLWDGRGGAKKQDDKPEAEQPAAGGATPTPPVVDTSGPPVPAPTNGAGSPPAKDPFGRSVPA